MFTHFKVKKLLSAYLDNELSLQERELVERHLEICPSCRKRRAELRKLSNTLKEWPEQELTPDLEQKIRKDFLSEKYKEAYPMNRKTALRIGIGSSLVAVVLLFVLVGQLHFKRGYQGRLKDSSYRIGEQFSAVGKVAEKKAFTGTDTTSRQSASAPIALYNQQYRNTYAAGAYSDSAKVMHRGGGEEKLQNQASQTTSVEVETLGALDGGTSYSGKRSSAPYIQDERRGVIAGTLSTGAAGNAWRCSGETLKGKSGNIFVRSNLETVASRKEVSKDGDYESYRYAKADGAQYLPVTAVKTPAPAAYYENGMVIIKEITLPATGREDYVIRDANVGVEVADVQDGYDAVAKISQESGGYLAQAYFKEEKTEEGLTEKVAAQIILRIPKEKLEPVLDEIKKLGSVKDFNIQSNDVSREYNSLRSEFNLTKVIYDKLRKKYEAKSNSIDEAIAVESELTPYERKMEGLKARMAELDNFISMSTVTVDLSAADVRYDAYLKIEIDDLAKAYDEAGRLSRGKSGRVISGGYQQELASRNQAQVSLRVPIARAEDVLAELKKLGKVKGFNVDSKNLSPDAEKNGIKGNARIVVDLYVPEWKALWRENTQKAKERLVEMMANTLGSAVGVLPAIILGTMGLMIFVALAIVVIAVVRKSGKKNE